MEKTSLIQKAALLLSAVREERPLVHCITNYVAANDSANLLLAVGASPIMADCAAEASEIAEKADGRPLEPRHTESGQDSCNAAGRRDGEPAV